MHARMHAHTCTHARTHARMHARTHTHTHTHTHTQIYHLSRSFEYLPCESGQNGLAGMCCWFVLHFVFWVFCLLSICPERVNTRYLPCQLSQNGLAFFLFLFLAKDIFVGFFQKHASSTTIYRSLSLTLLYIITGLQSISCLTASLHSWLVCVTFVFWVFALWAFICLPFCAFFFIYFFESEQNGLAGICWFVLHLSLEVR